jgi:hypothetical protein
LGYQGDPEPVTNGGLTHEQHIWHVDKIKALVANQDEAAAISAGVLGNFRNLLIYLMAFSSLKSILTH